jgi:hypothetical protein
MLKALTLTAGAYQCLRSQQNSIIGVEEIVRLSSMVSLRYYGSIVGICAGVEVGGIETEWMDPWV